MNEQRMRLQRRTAARRARVLWIAALLAASACSSSAVHVNRVAEETAYRNLRANALADGEPSNATRIVLRRRDLTEAWRKSCAGAIASLHEISRTNPVNADEIFALAELSYLYARKVTPREAHFRPDLAPRLGDPPLPPPRRPLYRAGEKAAAQSAARSYYLASALYAFAFLFPEHRAARTSLIDPRARVAADIYNRAVSAAFAVREDRIEPQSGTFPLPFGEIEVSFDPANLEWGERRLVHLRPIADQAIAGLNNQYRRAGVGAPLAVQTEPLDPQAPVHDLVGRNVWIPAALVLRFDRPREQLRQSELQGRLDLYTAIDSDEVVINRREVPIEFEPSVALAATLEQSRFWESELARFLGRAIHLQRGSNLVSDEPYQAGRIPVVFVHGTDSTPGSWANLVNDLRSDREIRERFHFWYFSYESGNPILYSSMLLRRALVKAVQTLDPSGSDPCLRQMVIIGHSQGGLLTKNMVIESGSRFWDASYNRPFDKVRLRAATRDLLREVAFFEPLPFVRRVVFVSTPHRGSYLAGFNFVRRLATRLIQMPADITTATTDMVGLSRFSTVGPRFGHWRTSIDNMSPGDTYIRTSAAIPLAPGVVANSIISLNPDEDYEFGSDGVVKYSSAHLEGVESELVVRSGHSCQGNPHTVSEIHRILDLHADQAQCGQVSGRPGGAE